jgi:hypothetical protein
VAGDGEAKRPAVALGPDAQAFAHLPGRGLEEVLVLDHLDPLEKTLEVRAAGKRWIGYGGSRVR